PFRPLIDGQKVVGLRKAIGFDKDCWVVQPLADWYKNAIDSWQYVLSDYDNLCFYARQSIFLKQIKTNPDKSSYSLLYDVAEKIEAISQEDLWIETEQFFNRLGLAKDII
ncbi:MAG: hypothetical protein JNN15_21235, partial [Blastocatellia bacterium]|nr:hypothetical protein [Blastocatellia bacterium]